MLGRFVEKNELGFTRYSPVPGHAVLGLTNANQPAPTNPIETDRVCPSPTESDRVKPSLIVPNRVQPRLIESNRV